MLKIIANAIIFQTGWILSVLYGNSVATAVAVTTLIIYLVYYRRNSRDIMFLLAIVSMGWLGDATLGLTAVLKYPTNAFYPPFWLITLWLLFATALPWSLEWIVKRKIPFIIFACLGGTMSYVVGVNLSAVEYGKTGAVVFPALLVIWAIYGFLIHQLYRWWKQGQIT